MIKFVNAKLNLGLDILKKRSDGYHELSTLFYPVGLFNGTPENPEPFCDILEIVRRVTPGKNEFYFSGNPIDCPLEKNLVFKAVAAFQNALITRGIIPNGYCVRLEKRIPDGAGLGGGSADAAFTLKLLNSLEENPFSYDEVSQMALSLGADCPFFILNSPAIASGIGEILRPFPLDLDGYWALIIKTPVYISTKEAFAHITPFTPEKSIEEILAYPIEKWEEEGLKNDFETSVFKAYPSLRHLKNSLYDLNALYAAMSGSGSSIFGIFKSRESADDAKRDIRKFLPQGSQTFICKL